MKRPYPDLRLPCLFLAGFVAFLLLRPTQVVVRPIIHVPEPAVLMLPPDGPQPAKKQLDPILPQVDPDKLIADLQKLGLSDKDAAVFRRDVK